MAAAYYAVGSLINMATMPGHAYSSASVSAYCAILLEVLICIRIHSNGVCNRWNPAPGGSDLADHKQGPDAGRSPRTWIGRLGLT